MTKFLEDPSGDSRASHVGTRHDSTHGTDDQIVECIVHFVDVFNYTFDGHTTGNTNVKGVPFPEIQTNSAGHIRYPSCGDRVNVKIGTGNTATYLGHASQIEKIDDDSRPTFSFTEKPMDHQYLRTPKMPGDWEWFAKGGAFLSLMRGGLVKFGASPMCQFVMGKWENFWRIISQNWEIFSCGMNAYSINHNGKITTRFSFFPKDTFGQHFNIKGKEWSARSDFDVMIDLSGINMLAGEVEEKPITLGGFIRKNRLKVFIKQDGTVIIDQGLIAEEDTFRQEVTLGPYGKFFRHRMWDKNKTNVYDEAVHVDDNTNFCSRILYMEGSHELNVKGTVSISASDSVTIDAPIVTIGTEKSGTLTTVNGIKFTGNVTTHSFTGV